MLSESITRLKTPFRGHQKEGMLDAVEGGVERVAAVHVGRARQDQHIEDTRFLLDIFLLGADAFLPAQRNVRVRMLGDPGFIGRVCRRLALLGGAFIADTQLLEGQLLARADNMLGIDDDMQRLDRGILQHMGCGLGRVQTGRRRRGLGDHRQQLSGHDPLPSAGVRQDLPTPAKWRSGRSYQPLRRLMGNSIPEPYIDIRLVDRQGRRLAPCKPSAQRWSPTPSGVPARERFPSRYSRTQG